MTKSRESMPSEALTAASTLSVERPIHATAK
jgi:hypothetical protein